MQLWQRGPQCAASSCGSLCALTPVALRRMPGLYHHTLAS